MGSNGTDMRETGEIDVKFEGELNDSETDPVTETRSCNGVAARVTFVTATIR